MSLFQVSPEKIREIVERVSRQQRQQTMLLSGETKEMIVFDAMERRADLILATIDLNDWNGRVYVASKLQIDTNMVAKLLNLMQNMKLARIRARVLGSRILDIEKVEEYIQPLSEKVMVEVGTVERSRTGARVWINTENGRYLVSDMSIKGMILCGSAIDGDVIAFISIKTKTSAGVPLIQFIAWEKVPIEKPSEETQTVQEELSIPYMEFLRRII